MNSVARITMLVSAGLLLFSGTAAAQVYAPERVYEPVAPYERFPVTDIGVAVSIGGGVGGFIEEDARDVADMGGAWDARLVIGTRSVLGVELAYIGAAYDLEAPLLDDDAFLVSNGAEIAARLNLIPGAPVTPIVFGGIGFRHFSLTNDDFNQSRILDDEDVAHFPVGAGLAFHVDDLLVELRGEVRPTTGDDDMLGDDDTNLSTWAAKARLGFVF